jgi:hypothetical protein
MANDDKTHLAANAPTQAQMGTGNPKDAGKDKKPEKAAAKADEPQFFEGTITKLVDRPVLDKDGEDTGETETYEVLSDNLYPGEKLKRADDEEKAAKKVEAARKDAKDAAEKRGTDK